MADGIRSIRVPEELWEQALEKARRERTSLSMVIRNFLEDYVDNR